MMNLRSALAGLEHARDILLGDRAYTLPATPLAALGDASFAHTHGVRFNYMAGAMANGIASVDLVAALAREGFLGIYGAAGHTPERLARALDTLQREVGENPYGVNLIHSPQEPDMEYAAARLLDARGVRLVEASAFLRLTPAVVCYRVRGLLRGEDGRIRARNRIIAKVSRVEVATQFLSPAPAAIVSELLARGEIDAEQAALASQVPMCDDLTVEADSGGHTDNRPLVTLVPTMSALRDRLARQHGYAGGAFGRVPRIGAAGGIGTPDAAAAAYAMGAAYVVTGSINQACVESGTSPLVRKMLAEAGQADVAMCPAADMFEMGVKVQVLKRGTMFPMRASKLYELYQRHRSLEDIPESERATLEAQVFKAPLAQVWEDTKRYFEARDPRECAKGEADARHRMALVFRSYLGQASHWANAGVEDRRFDFQVWCGPAMGAFNEWTRDTFLANPEERRVATVAYNIVFGAAVSLRAQYLAMQGAALAREDLAWRPLPLVDLRQLSEGAHS
jgi:PfaD family protein